MLKPSILLVWQFLGAFEKFSVRVEQLGSHWTDFDGI
jgi:hypothetical protein